ncbi:MAG: S1 RNA-binding domain-containing protein [Epsilonproteobacteria bacterium]|nr:S1 RNA-binding domain-containing protein [Campylobacterota bacterium]
MEIEKSSGIDMTKETGTKNEDIFVEEVSKKSDDDDNHESMTNYLKEMEKEKDKEPGSMVKATVVKVSSDEVFVDIGAKTEGIIKIGEFKDDEGNANVKVGDSFDVVLVRTLSEDGFTLVSKREADKNKCWIELEEIFNSEKTVEGKIIKRVKGGYYVDIGVTAFLPGSQVGARTPHDYDSYIGNSYKYNIISLNKDRSNIVVSRKAVVKKENEERKAAILSKIEEGLVVEGIIKSIVAYGLFVDIGGFEGLVHVSNLSWGRIPDPQKAYKVGDKITVKIIRFDKETEKVYLGIKQLSEDPWNNIPSDFVEDAIVEGIVKNIVSYGIFVELKGNLEGLVHLSEVSWDKSVKASKIVKPGDKIKVKILAVDPQKRRIALSMKQVTEDPWIDIGARYHVGDTVVGTVTACYDFGAFVKLETGVEGLIHKGDITWYSREPNPKEMFKINDPVTAIVLLADEERRKIALSTKMLEGDPWEQVSGMFFVGDQIEGEVVNLKDFGAFVDIAPGVEGLVHVSELDNLPADERKKIKEHTKVKVEMLRIDKARHRIGLSIVKIVDSETESSEEPKPLQSKTASNEESKLSLQEDNTDKSEETHSEETHEKVHEETHKEE